MHSIWWVCPCSGYLTKVFIFSNYIYTTGGCQSILTDCVCVYDVTCRVSWLACWAERMFTRPLSQPGSIATQWYASLCCCCWTCGCVTMEEGVCGKGVAAASRVVKPRIRKQWLVHEEVRVGMDILKACFHRTLHFSYDICSYWIRGFIFQWWYFSEFFVLNYMKHQFYDLVARM